MYNLLLFSATLSIMVITGHSQHLDSILSDKSYLDKVEKHIVASVEDITQRFTTESRKMERATKQFVLVKLRQNFFEALLTITDRNIVGDDRKGSRQDDGLGSDITNLIDTIENEEAAQGLNTGLRISQGILKFIDKAAKQVFGGLLTVITGISGGGAGAGGAGGAAASAAGSGGGSKVKGNTANSGKVKVTKGHDKAQQHQPFGLDNLWETLSSARNKSFHVQFNEILSVTPGVNFLSSFKRFPDNVQSQLTSFPPHETLLRKPFDPDTDLTDEGYRKFIGYLTSNYLKIWQTRHPKSIPDLYSGIDEPLNVLKYLDSVNVAVANKVIKLDA